MNDKCKINVIRLEYSDVAVKEENSDTCGDVGKSTPFV